MLQIRRDLPPAHYYIDHADEGSMLAIGSVNPTYFCYCRRHCNCNLEDQRDIPKVGYWDVGYVRYIDLTGQRKSFF